MLIVSEISDAVPVFPPSFHLPTHVAITNHLNKKYSNRVLQEVGLCFCVWDLIECGDGKVRWGDGAVWYKVKFNLLVFSPVIGEVLVGRVQKCDKEWIKISLGFFDDIYVPRERLPDESYRYVEDHDDQPAGVWLWKVPQDEDEANSGEPQTELPITNGGIIRLRIRGKTFKEYEPLPPRERMQNGGDEKTEQEKEAERPPGFTLEAEINGDGLGLTEWWPCEEAEEDDDAMKT